VGPGTSLDDMNKRRISLQAGIELRRYMDCAVTSPVPRSKSRLFLREGQDSHPVLVL
jgi:hypothetical protein